MSSLSPEELDSILVHCDSGMELALKRAKAWSKYAKDIITYVEKRAVLGAFLFHVPLLLASPPPLQNVMWWQLVSVQPN